MYYASTFRQMKCGGDTGKSRANDADVCYLLTLQWCIVSIFVYACGVVRTGVLLCLHCVLLALMIKHGANSANIYDIWGEGFTY